VTLEMEKVLGPILGEIAEYSFLILNIIFWSLPRLIKLLGIIPIAYRNHCVVAQEIYSPVLLGVSGSRGCT